MEWNTLQVEVTRGFTHFDGVASFLSWFLSPLSAMTQVLSYPAQ